MFFQLIVQNFDTYIDYNVCSKTLQNKLIKLTLDNS